MQSQIKYVHEESVHNLSDPMIIVPLIIELFNPKSVVDIGCGIGTFLHIFNEMGVQDLLGLDGVWVNKKELSKNISLDYFKEIDLEKGIHLERKFDLAICLEVLEHVDSKYSDIVIKNITELSDIIIFSAAIPGQVGQNHVNEQWLEYWEEKFSNNGFKFHDVFRPIFWNNEELAVWYKQNMFLVVRDNLKIDFDIIHKHFDTRIKNYIHPGFYNQRVSEISQLNSTNIDYQNQINTIVKGEKSFRFYIKLILRFLASSLGLRRN